MLRPKTPPRVSTALSLGPDSAEHTDTVLELSAAVGERLRRARESAGLSMRALAGLAGVSQPFLSQVERGTATPSLYSLYRIARALSIAPSELMPDVSAAREIRVLRSGEGTRLPVSEETGAATGRLLSGGPGSRLEVREYRVLPGQDLGDWFESAGDLTLYVADGALEVTLDGHGAWELAAGDSISHPSDIRHRWRAVGSSESRILLSVVHALPRLDTGR